MVLEVTSFLDECHIGWICFNEGEAEQSIPSYNGYHAGLNMEQWKSKACFHMSYSQPPNMSVVKDIMDKVTYGWFSILQNEKQLLVHSIDVNNVARTRAPHNLLAIEKMPRGSTWTAAQNGCETMSRRERRGHMHA